METCRNMETHGDMDTLHIHIHMETWRHSMSIAAWRHVGTRRHGEITCPYLLWKQGNTPSPYPHGDMETLHVHINMET